MCGSGNTGRKSLIRRYGANAAVIFSNEGVSSQTYLYSWWKEDTAWKQSAFGYLCLYLVCHQINWYNKVLQNHTTNADCIDLKTCFAGLKTSNTEVHFSKYINATKLFTLLNLQFVKLWNKQFPNGNNSQLNIRTNKSWTSVTFFRSWRSIVCCEVNDMLLESWRLHNSCWYFKAICCLLPHQHLHNHYCLRKLNI